MSDALNIRERNWKAAIAHLPNDIRAKLMAKYSITYHGDHYEMGGYRHDSLAGAVVYGKMRRCSGQ